MESFVGVVRNLVNLLGLQIGLMLISKRDKEMQNLLTSIGFLGEICNKVRELRDECEGEGEGAKH